MSGVDIIGDVHGHASKLEHRLQDLGYTIDADTGAYRHAERSAVFVGDLIDRGPEQLRVLQIVKAMVDSGSARMVLGNHEFNAIAYATEHPDRPGEYLRPHNDKNTRQHAAFLEQLTAEQQRYYLDWFGTLPLWLDLGGRSGGARLLARAVDGGCARGVRVGPIVGRRAPGGGIHQG